MNERIAIDLIEEAICEHIELKEFMGSNAKYYTLNRVENILKALKKEATLLHGVGHGVSSQAGNIAG